MKREWAVNSILYLEALAWENLYAFILALDGFKYMYKVQKNEVKRARTEGDNPP